jgi:PQQ-dependent dehydrogenase (methanol/ethanol family)
MIGRMAPRRRSRGSFVGLCGLAAAACTVLVTAASSLGAEGDVDWRGFGNTPDGIRHSPLKQITKSNVDQLGRVFTVDFRRIDPSIRRGQQSFPVIADGTLYVTTNNDNVFALDATNGDVKWRWRPDNEAVFANFGIVANRGVALCDGHVFLLTLDMTIVSLNARTGRLERRVPIARAVPGASSDYGYSETSAPICANHRVILGAAGSEYGVRGFVMAYTTNLEPAWSTPFWTIPPAGTSWRRLGTLVGGGVVWTPTTVDPTTNTLYFGTGSATPLYFPGIRPGSNPRANSLIAVDLRTGRMKWWQQQLAHNEWAYDTAQPPLVYTGRVGGERRRIVSVGTMEGVWFAYDAATGRPIHERVKVIDRTEHPRLKPGQPVAIFPASLGGLNYSPASYDPGTNYLVNAAAETAAVLVQTKLTPTQRKRKRLQGDVFLGLQNGNFGQVLPGWRDHGSISAIDVNTGRRVWKFRTPEPERGGVATTDSGLGFAGGGDGVLRAFDVKNGKVLWRFQTGHQIAGGAAIYSVNGKQYVAITSGGTPTSSNGGTASELQVFALGGSKNESPPPNNLPSRGAPLQASSAPSALASTPRISVTPAEAESVGTKSATKAPTAGRARITTQSAIPVRPWDADSSNVQPMTGRVRLAGAPVVGARVSVDGYRVTRLTGPDGSFSYPADSTVAKRYVARVVGLARARVRARALTAAEKKALLGPRAGFNVGYRLSGVRARVQGNGSVLVTGRVTDTRGTPPPPARLVTYRLSGTITDADGRPVRGAVVITRTQDRDFWTFSSASDAAGRYTSFFSASDETDADPVPLSVGVALGGTNYGGTLGTIANFDRLRSSTMNIQLGSGGRYTLSNPQPVVGAIYQGIVVGVSGPRGVIRPLRATWPDRSGRFSLLLPATARGDTLSFWQNQHQFFSRRAARPGGPIELTTWPRALGESVPRGLAALRAPSR